MLTWCVQRKQPIPIWQNVFHLSKDPLVFVLFAVTCIMAHFCLYFWQQFEESPTKWDYSRILLIGIACGCGFPSEYRPKITSNRVLFSSILLGTLLLGIHLLTFVLKTIQTTIFENQIDSIPEIFNSFELVGDEFALKHLLKQNNVNNLLFHIFDGLLKKMSLFLFLFF